MLYMVTFTINIPQMLAYIPYMDPMGYELGYPLVHEANLGYGITQIRSNSLWKHHPKQR